MEENKNYNENNEREGNEAEMEGMGHTWTVREKKEGEANCSHVWSVYGTGTSTKLFEFCCGARGYSENAIC